MNEGARERSQARAQGCCEYCLYPETESLITHQLDHVVARQHGGTDHEDNLAYCCAVCNRYKGPNLSSVDPDTGEVTRLFNPRTQRWGEHFVLEDEHIIGTTPEGRATVFLLRFNDEERLAERRVLIASGRYN